MGRSALLVLMHPSVQHGRRMVPFDACQFTLVAHIRCMTQTEEADKVWQPEYAHLGSTCHKIFKAMCVGVLMLDIYRQCMFSLCASQSLELSYHVIIKFRNHVRLNSACVSSVLCLQLMVAIELVDFDSGARLLFEHQNEVLI